ncbi:MAG: putative tellurite resistance protein B-like protein [Sphingobacteriales bacterium]|jgi:uncharacterized tellurite resistance protein B-like protein
MSIVDAFDSGEERRSKSHVKNLIRLAQADGEIDEAEKAMIFKVGKRNGITEEEIQDILDKPDSVSFNPPSDLEGKLERFVGLMRMILIDGIIDEVEAKLIRRLGIGLGLNEEKIADYSDLSAAMIGDEQDTDDIVEALRKK